MSQQHMTPERLAEIREHDAQYDGIPVGRNSGEHHRHELLAEVNRLRSIHGHDFTDIHQEPVTCVCGVTLVDWLEARKNGSDQ